MSEDQTASRELTDRVALVTGAGKGIGRATALALAAGGARVGLMARTRCDLERVAAAIAAAGGQALVCPGDVSVEKDCAAAVAAIQRQWGAVDLLINNAGAGRFQPLEELSVDEFDATVAVNLRGAFLLCRRLIPAMRSAGRGDVVNIISIAGQRPFPMAAAYCASKWGALGLTLSLAEELRETGVRVTALCPGAVDTPFWNGVDGGPDRARMLRPEDVARAVVQVVTQPPSATVDMLTLMPPGGVL